MRGGLRCRLGAGLLLLGLAPAALLAQPADRDAAAKAVTEAIAAASGGRTDLTPEELRLAALQMLRIGRPDVTAAFTDALLARDPEDFEALLLRARALRDLGRMEAASDASSRAWAAAEGDEQHYAAAMVRAQVLSSDGHRTMAQLWLRRAAEHAPDDRARARARRDFQYVKARNPWSTKLRFRVAPSSNVNNGSSRDRVRLFDLPFDLTLQGSAQALSGVEYAFGADTRYRMAEGANHAHDLLLEFDHKTYTLSSEAKAMAPGVEGSDFNYTSVAIGYAYHHRSAPGVEHEIVAEAGRNWYGGAHYGDFLSLDYDHTRRLGGGSRVAFGLGGELRFGPKAPEADIVKAHASYGRAVPGGLADVFVSGAVSSSDTSTADYRDWQVGARYQLGQPVGGTLPMLTVTYGHRDYDRTPFTSGGRTDDKLGIRLDVIFPEVEYYGFNPMVSLNASRTASTVDLYDTDELGLSFSIRSAF